MPHDMNGIHLQENDVVTMRMRVKAVYPTELACNVTLVAIDGPAGEYKPEVSCNTRLVALASAVQEVVAIPEPGALGDGPTD